MNAEQNYKGRMTKPQFSWVVSSKWEREKGQLTPRQAHFSYWCSKAGDKGI